MNRQDRKAFEDVQRQIFDLQKRLALQEAAMRKLKPLLGETEPEAVGILQTTLAKLESQISVRLYNCIKNLKTLKDETADTVTLLTLVQVTDWEWLHNSYHMGGTTLAELKEFLERMGLKTGMSNKEIQAFIRTQKTRKK